MKLADLERSLESEIKTGRLGVPVALRIHAAMPTTLGDILSVLGFSRPLFSLIGDINRGTVQAKRHPSGKQATVLWTEATGKTVFMTLVATANTKPALNVFLIGNHGMTQLEGAEDWCDDISGEFPAVWEKEIQESLRKGTSIPVPVS